VRTYPFEAREGLTTDLVVVPGPRLPGAAGSGARRTAGYVALGIGGSALALGAVTGLTVIARGNERQALCPKDSCATPSALDDARSIDSSGRMLSVISTTAFAVGGVAAAAGIYFLLTAPAARVDVAPAAGPGAWGLRLTRSF
jgi:hypothetical protein